MAAPMIAKIEFKNCDYIADQAYPWIPDGHDLIPEQMKAIIEKMVKSNFETNFSDVEFPFSPKPDNELSSAS